MIYIVIIGMIGIRVMRVRTASDCQPSRRADLGTVWVGVAARAGATVLPWATVWIRLSGIYLATSFGQLAARAKQLGNGRCLVCLGSWVRVHIFGCEDIENYLRKWFMEVVCREFLGDVKRMACTSVSDLDRPRCGKQLGERED